MNAATLVRRKWRPSLWLVLTIMLTVVMALPLAGLTFFRLHENQLVRQTEAELIGQAAVLAAVLQREIAGFPEEALSAAPAAPPDEPTDGEPYRPIAPALDLTHDPILPPRPAAGPAAAAASPLYQELGRRIAPDLVAAQRTTLAGFRILDPNGVVVAGRDEVGLSLGHVEEVAGALAGRVTTVMRQRISSRPQPPVYSWSRGTGLRIFLAMPVTVHGRVAAVVYASRTPSNVFRSLYEERRKLAWAGLSVAAATLVIGLVFHRTVSGPMRELMRRARAVTRGEHDAFAPIAHSGTREFAQLSESFLDMAASLRSRSDYVATFAAHVSHELKSPLTSIQGAAELLRDDVDLGSMTPDERRRFLDNIAADTRRLTAIVQRLRDLARAETSPIAGSSPLAPIVADLASAFDRLTIAGEGDLDVPVRMGPENLRIVLTHLADNAARHGARTLTIHATLVAGALDVAVADDGTGVSPNNRAKLFEAFFTTRRDSGGTGMGLAIVRAMMTAHGGAIVLAEAAETDDETMPGPARGPGAVFSLRFPLQSEHASA